MGALIQGFPGQEIPERLPLKQGTERQMKKLAGLFTSQWGALMESLVEGDLVPLLQARGITVRYTHCVAGAMASTMSLKEVRKWWWWR